MGTSNDIHSEDISLVVRRQRAGQLLAEAMTENISPRQALNRWPVNPLSGGDDPSLMIAYQALWHFEADEEKQQSELYYMDAQLELLRQMSLRLSAGEALPSYMTEVYSPEHTAQFYDENALLLREPLQRARQIGSHWQKLYALWQNTVGLLAFAIKNRKPKPRP